jgi:translation initiation factor 1
MCSEVDDFNIDAQEKDTSKVHLRIQQRTGRKCITIIQGLASDLDSAKIAKYLKKEFKCNGSITNDVDYGEIIQLSGDQRANVREFFIDQEICHEDQIVIHGG